MFRPGNLGHLGRLGLVAASRPSLVARALAILAKYGSAANLYLPGVGTISGITAGNWLDNIGTTAAAVDNTVGLVVSAGKPIGTERAINGDFGSGTTAWTAAANASISNVSGALRLTSTISGVGARLANQTINGLSVGTTYLITASVGSFGGAGAQGTFPQVQVRNASDTATIASIGASAFTNTTISGVFVATETTQRIRPRWDGDAATNTTSYLDFDNISVRELPGAHLTQSTAANRPVLRQSAGVYAWDFVSSDSFTSTMAPGNAGFFCGSASVTDSGVLRTLLGAGAGSDASSGVWLARQVSSNLLMLMVGNGTTRNSIGAPYPVATNAVASAGWDASAMFVGINGSETSGAKTVNCTSSNTMNIGVLTGTTNPMLGTIGATIIMPTVLPTATERATLRQFVASLSGVTM